MDRTFRSPLLSGLVLAVLLSTVSTLDFGPYRGLDKSGPYFSESVEKSGPYYSESEEESVVSYQPYTFYQCLDKSAHHFESVEEGVDFTCRYSNMAGKCFDEFVDATTAYIREFIQRDAFEKSVKRLCQRKQEVIEAIKCAYGIQGSSKSKQQPSECKKQLSPSAGKCKLVELSIKCTPGVKAKASCFSGLVKLLEKSGIDVTCASVLTSSSPTRTASDKSAPDFSKEVEDSCRYSNMTGKFFDEFVDGNSGYIRQFIQRDAFEETVKRLCLTSKQEVKNLFTKFNEASKCASGIQGSSKKKQQPSECKKQLSPSAAKCKLVERAIKCTPGVKAIVSCYSGLVKSLKKSGMDVPCASVITSSSVTRPCMSTLVLSSMLLVIPLNKFL